MLRRSLIYLSGLFLLKTAKTFPRLVKLMIIFTRRDRHSILLLKEDIHSELRRLMNVHHATNEDKI